MKDLPEADWKRLQSMKVDLLRRASRTAIEHVHGVVIGPNDDPHKVYLNLYRVVESEDRKIGDMFNDMRRSTAILRLGQMVRHGVITTEELQSFTEETQERARELGRANQAL
jgi:hypothetical protein